MRYQIPAKMNVTQAYVFFTRNNVEVTRTYLDTISAALRNVGYSCKFVTSLYEIPKSSLIIFATGVDAFKYYFKGYRNIVLWQQGATGAESFMRHGSKIRKFVLDFMDCFVMKRAKMVFYVSQYMKEYYEKMARADFTEKSYVMPCFNESLDSSVFDKKDYSRKTFTYIGSLSVWQCFSETAEIYAEIEKKIPDAFFKVLTFDTENAERILREKNIKNYSVACVPKEKVKQELEEVSFGFIIRRDVDVNRVATPTKISSYLSAGVLPIYSSCLKDFHAQAQGKNLAIAQNPGEDVDAAVRFVSGNIDKNVVQKEIEDLFDSYYSVENHINKIVDLAKERLL